MIHKISMQELKDILSEDIPYISDHDKDEMAIPSYLHWNPLIRWLMWRRYEAIAQLAGFLKDMTVLEFGCGVGLFLPELHQQCGQVYAIDLFPEFAKRLNQKFGLNVHFIHDLSEISDHSLDLIIAADVLEHLEANELAQYLKTFAKKLRRSGRLIVSGPTENFVYKIGRFLAGFSGKGDYHHTNVNHLIDRISQTFELRRTHYLPFRFPPFLFKICEFKCSS